MRRILIENARRKAAAKHGGELQRVILTEADAEETVADSKLLDLNAALEEYEKQEPEKAKLVMLRYFAGLTEEEAAQSLGVSRATASRWWTFSKAWLFERMSSKS
jgi:RNA polymerase sigma factor (TIGR02999 family)